MTNQTKTLDELRAEADELGIEYAKTLGATKLADRIAKFKEGEETSDKTTKKVKKTLLDTAPKTGPLSLKKVIISNLDQNNTGASTVYVCVENMTMSLARVLPLDKEMYVEEALIRAIKDMKTISHKPKKEMSGRLGSVATPTEVPMYAVASVD